MIRDLRGHLLHTVIFLVLSFFPLLRRRDSYIFFTRHIMRVRLLTIYIPYWHGASILLSSCIVTLVVYSNDA